MPHDTRDAVVDYVRTWSEKSDIPVSLFLRWVGITTSKFHDWKKRFGQINEHNSWVPRDHWLADDEKDRIRAFARAHPLEGYRRLTFMMLDANEVACISERPAIDFKAVLGLLIHEPVGGVPPSKLE